MSARSWFTIATFTVSLTILAIILILVPHQDWAIDSVTSLVLLSSAVVQLCLVRQPRLTRGDDAPAVASLGTSGLLTVALLAITSVALLLGLDGQERWCWIFNVLAVGVFIAVFSLMRATSAVVGKLASTAASSQPSRWIQNLQSMVPLVAEDDLRAQLERLSENVRYAASNPRGSSIPENEMIDAGLSRLSEAIASRDLDRSRAEVHQLETRLAQREAALKLLRTRT